MNLANLKWLLLVVLAQGCARNPSKVEVFGSSEGVYQKSDFEGKTFVVGQASGSGVDLFVAAALAREEKTSANLHLVTSEQDLIKNGKLVTFKTSARFLTMTLQGSDEPVAQWGISGHCRLEAVHNQKGEETRFQDYRCDTGENSSSYPAFRANYNNVSVRELDNGQELVVPKATLLGKTGLTETLFTLKTGTFKNKGLAVTVARELVLEPGFHGFTDLRPVHFSAPNLPLVDFSDEVLSDVEFLGKENTEYQLRLRLTENHLLVEKVVDEEGLGPQEKTYAQELGNGLFAVTIVGYPVSRLKYQHVVDQGEKMVDLSAYPVSSLEETTHLKLDEKQPQKFVAVAKQDVFDADFFKVGDEWYFERSIIDRPIDTLLDPEIAGILPGHQVGAGKVRVHKNKNSVQFLDVNIPTESKNVDGEKLNPLLEIPARWIDFRIVSTGSQSFLREEALEDGHLGANEWDKRKYAIFDFNRADNLDAARSDQFKLKKLEIGPDYIGFQVYHSVIGLTFKYSLVKAKKTNSLAGRTYPRQDQEIFGFWDTVKSFYPGIMNDFLDVRDSNIVLHRAYPERDPNNENKPTIWIHLTKGMQNDDFLVDAVQDAVTAWDETFAVAAKGTGKEPISVKLADTLVEVGDVRFNKVVFWGYGYDTRPSGYGPSVADQTSGNIVNATNHIYLRRYREIIFGEIRDYIRYQLGFFEDKKLSGVDFLNDEVLSGVGSLPGGLSGPRTLMSGEVREFDKSLFVVSPEERLALDQTYDESNTLFRSPLHERASKIDLGDITSVERFKAGGHYLQPRQNVSRLITLTSPGKKGPLNFPTNKAADMCAFPAALANTFQDIRSLCDDPKSGVPVFREYLNELRQMQKEGGEFIAHLEDKDASAYTVCAERILRKKITATLVHEFGHNFGMTHNFAASADAANYPVNSAGQITAHMSSVMEYPDNDEDRAVKPGPYDIAAIRYAYFDTIEVKDPRDKTSKLVSIIPGTTIAKTIDVKVPGGALKKYLFCNEFDLEEGYGLQRPTDKIYCRRWDKGATPSERVDAAIKSMQANLSMLGKRFDGAGNPNPAGLANYVLETDMITLKILYDHFRLSLAKKTALSDKYLMNVKSQEDLEALVLSLNDKELWDGYQASRKSFTFLKQLALSPVRYCVVVDIASNPKAYRSYSFEPLRQEIFLATQNEEGMGKTVNTCEEAAPYLKGRKELAAYNKPRVYSVGNLFNNLTASADPLSLNRDVPDLEAGLGKVRQLALMVMLMRLDTSSIGQKTNFRPAFFDEPGLRQDILASLHDRLISGEEILRWIPDVDDAEGIRDIFFAEEKVLLTDALNLLMGFGNAPDDSRDRLGELRVNVWSQADLDARAPEGTSGEDYLIQNGAVFLRDASGNYYWAQKNKPFVFNMIRRINVIELLKEPKLLVNSEDEIMPEIKKLTSFLEAMDAHLRVVLKDKLQSLGSPRPSDEDMDIIINAIGDSFQAAVGAKLLTSSEVEALIEAVMGLDEKGNFIFGFTPQNFSESEELKTLANNVLGGYMAKGLLYKEKQKEFDAQSEILRRFILSQ